MKFADSFFMVDHFESSLFSSRTAFFSLIFTPKFLYLFEISSFPLN